MADRSAIEWTDATWNPIRARNVKTGKLGWHCEHDTTGCEFCYAEGFNKRLGTGLAFKPGHRNDIEIFLDEEMLTLPLRWKKPRKIFVCSMTDLFASFVPDEFIDKMFAVMALAPQHTFQVLTKRAARMRDYFAEREAGDPWAEAADFIADLRGIEDHPFVLEPRHIPLLNVWLGVSAERQQEADERIPLLLQTPAAVRFISAEPLLGPIELYSLGGKAWAADKSALVTDALVGFRSDQVSTGRLNWVIVGGESGPHGRPIHPDWARSLRDQCAIASVPLFFKQWGAFEPEQTLPIAAGARDIPAGTVVGESESVLRNVAYAGHGRSVTLMRRVGKKAAGRLLDGVEHNGFPKVRA